jgi:peroxiredoxin
MVPLGSEAPDFALPDLTGALVRRSDLSGPLLVAFLCNHCPYVKHVEGALGQVLARREGLDVVGVCTNDAAAYPDDAPQHLAEQAARAGWTFPYLVDADQSVGRAFQAVCTPDFFLYDATGRLAYRGAFDDSTPGNGRPVTGALLADAIDRVLRDEPVPEPHRPSMGCSIKWRE